MTYFVFVFLSLILYVINIRLCVIKNKSNKAFKGILQSYNNIVFNKAFFEDYSVILSAIFWILVLCFIPVINFGLSIFLFGLNHDFTILFNPYKLFKNLRGNK